MFVYFIFCFNSRFEVTPSYQRRGQVHLPSDLLTQTIKCELRLKRKTPSSVQTHPGVENGPLHCEIERHTERYEYEYMKYIYIHRALFSPAIINRSAEQKHYVTDLTSVNSPSFPITSSSRFAYSRVKTLKQLP